MSLRHLEIGTNTIFDSDEYMKFVEDNLSFFMKAEDLDVFTFDPAISYKYEGDLYGLFAHLNIPSEMHYLTMRINGYDSPYEFDADVNEISIYKGDSNAAISKALSAKVR